MSTLTPARQPAGQPAGGQFAATTHAEPAVALAGSTGTVDERGVTSWRNAAGQLHRTDGPAHIDPTWPGGTREAWFLNGELHRADGPAVTDRRFLEWWDHGVNTRNVDRITGGDLGGTAAAALELRMEMFETGAPLLAAKARRQGFRGNDDQLAAEEQVRVMRRAGAYENAEWWTQVAATMRGTTVDDQVWRDKQRLDDPNTPPDRPWWRRR